jgi:hypothetical protein
MEAAFSSETSISFQWAIRRYIVEDQIKMKTMQLEVPSKLAF